MYIPTPKPTNTELGMKPIKTAIFLSIITSTTSFPLQADLTIKQSSSGLCHPPESSYYERTQNYIPYDSLQDCLDADGRLPKGLTLAALDREGKSKGKGGIPEYQRSAFGHGWADDDGDCQNSRAEALIDTSTTQVQFATIKDCRVVTGRWISPFTNQVIQNASDIDIDHVVPLAWSWDRGAGQWSREKREQFANDPINLWPVEAGLNRSTITI